MSKQARKLTTIAGLVVVYFVAGKLGLTMATVHPSATPGSYWNCARGLPAARI